MTEVEYWKAVRTACAKVVVQFRTLGVYQIDPRPYEDSVGRPAVRFTVWLKDKPGDAQYEWTELSGIERELTELLRDVDPDRSDYTAYAEYVLESETAERAAAVS